MIQMICGACRVDNTLKRAADGPFSLSPEAEQRLVDAGAAKYTEMPYMCAEDGDSMNTVDLCEETAQADDGLNIADGHFTVESLMQLTRANMDELAAKLDVDISKCKNKSEIAELLAAVNVEPDEGGSDSPDLGAAPPVI